MSDDRTLLEKAARAAGIAGEVAFDREGVLGVQISGSHFWRPLYDDGDALRLAIKLGIFVDTNANSASADGRHFMAQAGERDPYAATRRAIVRAAAASLGSLDEEKQP